MTYLEREYGHLQIWTADVSTLFICARPHMEVFRHSRMRAVHCAEAHGKLACGDVFRKVMKKKCEIIHKNFKYFLYKITKI